MREPGPDDDAEPTADPGSPDRSSSPTAPDDPADQDPFAPLPDRVDVAEAAADEIAAPLWFELPALTAGVAIASVGVVGLALSFLDSFEAITTLVAAVPLTLLGAWLLWRALPRSRPGRSGTAAALVAVALAVGFFAFTAARPSQNLVVDRDPGSYTNTSRWLARTGSLEVDARGEAFDDVAGLTFSGHAVYDIGDPVAVEPSGQLEGSGDLEFQFNHLTSVVLATGYEVGGIEVLFRLPALAVAAGLLLVYAVAVRATRRPWVALLAPVLLACCMPMIYVSRNTYSEPFTMVPLWGAVLLLSAFHTRPRLSLAVVGGFLLGTTVSVRIDALVYVILAVVLAGTSIASAPTRVLRRDRLRGWLVAAGAALVPAAVGTYDLYVMTGLYVDDLDEQIGQLRTGAAAVLVATVVAVAAWGRLPALRDLGSRLRRPLAIPAGVVVAAGLLAGWLVRPRVQDAKLDFPIPTVEQLQIRDGLEVDRYASYAQDSLRWMAWYLGRPALVVAIAALAYTAYRALRHRVEPAAFAILAITLGAGGLYWYEPSITPDQLWATRRFAPAVFPALALMVAVGLAAVADLDRVRGLLRRTAVAPVALVVATVGLLWPVVDATRPIQKHTMQPGFVRPVEQLCDALPDDAALLVVGRGSGLLLQQTFRSWCGVPTAGQSADLTAPVVAEIAAAVAGNGRTLYLVGQDEQAIEALVPSGGPPVFATDAAVSDHNTIATLDRRPYRYGGAFTLVIYAVPAAPG